MGRVLLMIKYKTFRNDPYFSYAKLKRRKKEPLEPIAVTVSCDIPTVPLKDAAS